MSNWSRRLAALREGMRLALMAVRSNKFRSIMTIIGVMIGVGAVIIVNTIMDGFQSYLYASIEKIGNNVMYITRFEEGTDFDNLTDEQRKRKPITMKEAEALRDMCTNLKAVAAQKRAFDNVAQYEDRKIRTPDDFRGCWPELAIVTNRDCSYGRFIDEADMRRSAMVCVIGPEIADALFDDEASALGKEIRVNGRRFTVVGVQERIDDFFGISENDFIYIPMSTFDKLYPGVERAIVFASAPSRELFPVAMDDVINVLRKVRRVKPEDENNFGILTQQQFKKEVADITDTVKLSAVAVACVGLLVGVIGVMNIMLVAVTQRTREIGVRKAVGARRSNIMFQFLVESATLTCLGGVVGIVFGAIVGLVVTGVLEWHYYFSPLWAVIGLIVSAGTGMAAGLYPAWRAARVDPIVALRYE